MRVVLDTNILVSGLLSPFGPSGEIVRMVSSGILELCFDARIVSEYRDVLSRPKFKFEPHHIDTLLQQIETCGDVIASTPLKSELPDQDDEPFLEVAIAGNAEYLVTGNIRHFPENKREGVKVIRPNEFLNVFRK